MLSFKCRDVGFDCDFVVKGDEETEIIEKVMVHGKNDHNMKQEDFSTPLLDQIKSKMQPVN